VGDDGQPRTVQALLDGVEDLYDVSQTNGMSYTVTGAHTLVLRRRDGIHEITVRDFLALSAPLQRTFEGYQTTGITSEISVKPVGPGEFYGWKVDGNHRFLLKDGTIARNCNQMFCLTCHTPWDWETGRIVTKGVIHNPHYYEWLRRTGGDMPRNPADVPCGGFPGGWELRRINHMVSHTHSQYFYEFHRVCMEIQERSEHQFRSHLDETAMHGTHISFLLNDFEEKEWGRRLAIAEKRRKRDAEIQEVFAAFRMIAVELLNRIQHYRDETVDAFVNLPRMKAEAYLETWNVEVQALIHMVNEGMKSISLSYSCAVPYIQTASFGKKTNYALQTKKWTAPKRGSASSSSSSSSASSSSSSSSSSTSSSSSSSASHPSRVIDDSDDDMSDDDVSEDEDDGENDSVYQAVLEQSLREK
jgi:hypothetical protein